MNINRDGLCPITGRPRVNILPHLVHTLPRIEVSTPRDCWILPLLNELDRCGWHPIRGPIHS